ncbi:hypothetical protein PAP_05895 [Palaeococcus pacificus DY20341]|uniref:Uncharacterized protein n=1 Tax=Palaeococcus pacificus DY20341 TaxID=1343739 RepID=A0A075LTD9_9EURY|nr:hypothetical protein [Palaeococcus pacificus]AIF69579.1 hypothetical protein PAP_05895 [Palaeococcus pacificus DY20341]
MKLSIYLLFLQAFFLLYYFIKASGVSAYTYLAFGVLNFVLAWGLIRGERRAVKATLIYKGIDLFFSILMLMAGSLGAGISALIDFVIIHDLVGLFGQGKEEGEVVEE